MRKWIVLSVLLVAVLTIAPANAQGNKFKVYAAFNYVSPTGSTDLTSDNLVERVEAADEAGWSIGFEWRLGKWAGLELDYLDVSYDIEADGVKVADTAMSPISGSFNFHLVHTKVIDFYFGPTVSYISWDDVTDLESGEKLSTDSEWGYGLQVGLDLSLFKSIAIVTGLRYQEVDLSVEDETVSVNPLYAKVGIAFRF